MNHRMSSRQRKSGNSSVKTRKQQKDRNYSIHSSSTLACLHYNTVANLMVLHTGLPVQTIPLTTHRHKYLLDPATTSMGSRVVHLVQTGTLLAETRAGVIIRAEEVTAADHILHKDGELLMWRVLEGLLAVHTGLDHLTTHKVVSMVALVALEEVRTQWVVVETSHTDGNSKEL